MNLKKLPALIVSTRSPRVYLHRIQIIRERKQFSLAVNISQPGPIVTRADCECLLYCVTIVHVFHGVF